MSSSLKAVADLSSRVPGVDEDVPSAGGAPDRERVRVALGEVYTALQDASSSLGAVHGAGGAEGGEERPDLAELLDPQAMWDELGCTQAGRDQLGWPHRVLKIREQLVGLVTAQRALDGAKSRADELQRENSSLSVELRAAKSRMAEISSAHRVASADAASRAEADDLKKENKVSKMREIVQ